MLSDLVARVSDDLNDHASGHEFTTWSAGQITEYLLEGLQIAYTLRPDLFIGLHVVKLTPGSSLQSACGCTQMRRIVGVCNAAGRVLYTLRKKRQSDRLLWHGPACPVDPRRYRAVEYSIDTEGDNFFIEPPPPAGQDTYVLVECAQVPSELTETTEIPVELRAPLVQWALFRAKMVDSENNATIFTVAREHRSTFFTLLNTSSATDGKLDADRNSGTRSLSSLAAAEQARAGA